MAFEGLQDQLKDKLHGVWASIQETNLYINLKERFENLNSTTQKLITFAVLGLTLIFFFSIPYDYHSLSFENMDTYHTHRELIDEMIKSYRIDDSSTQLPRSLGSSDIMSRIESIIREQNLIEEQIGSTIQLSGPRLSHLIPSSIQQEGFLIPLKSLNIRQVIDIGHKLSSLHKNLKLTSLKIAASTQRPDYFDSEFTLTNLIPPESPPLIEEEPIRTPKGRPSLKSRGNK